MPQRRKIELLAPAGNVEAVTAVIAAGADAVYFGGKAFNMRQHRPTLNLDHDQIAKAIRLCRDSGVKAYVTFNNLLGCPETDAAREELSFLDSQAPDAIIVQDLGTIEILRELKSRVPIHASTMMNAHNSEMVNLLAGLGVKRVITSRDLSLAEVKAMWQNTGIEMEYFVHGDMCVAESGQCYQSSVTFGESSNRGRCMKPCRWRYQLVRRSDGEEIVVDNAMLLAKKDMSLFSHLEEVIGSGIASLKIEGRARAPEFLHSLVALYRREIDRVLGKRGARELPDRAADEVAIDSLRVRDFSTCAAFGRPGLEGVDPSGAKEPRVFSVARPEKRLENFSPGHGEMPETKGKPLLMVAARHTPQALAALTSGADFACVPPDAFAEIGSARGDLGPRLGIATPRVVTDGEASAWLDRLQSLRISPDTPFEIYDLGLLRPLADLGFARFYGGFSLNVLNHLAVAALARLGFAAVTLSFESGFDNMRELIARSPLDVYAPAHGFIPGMLVDYCLAHETVGCGGPDHCELESGRWALRDTSGGEHDLYREDGCRVAISTAVDLCVLPWLPRFAAAGVKGFRLGLEHSGAEEVAAVTAVYRRHIDIVAAGNKPDADLVERDVKALIRSKPLGIGAYRDGCFKISEEGRDLEKILVGAATHS